MIQGEIRIVGELVNERAQFQYILDDTVYITARIDDTLQITVDGEPYIRFFFNDNTVLDLPSEMEVDVIS